NRVPVADTAFPHRDVLFLVSMDTSWGTQDPPEVVRANLAWLSGLYEQMGEFATDAAYVNFTDPDLTDWRSAYYGPNLDRLVAVKRRHDPDRGFPVPPAVLVGSPAAAPGPARALPDFAARGWVGAACARRGQGRTHRA